ncbi:MAG: Na(+)/H(+) antiporter NhaA [Ignavibacteriaceae bacterium]|nr:Na(+)/H(+) antiporter NhaA [Ignavibacteriaceae bacterium]
MSAKIQKNIRSAVLNPLVSFVKVESAGGIILLFCAAIALALANSSYASQYFTILNLKFTVGFDFFNISKPLLLWINDGLMAIFFFVVGLEIKRELVEGELSSVKKAMLPAAAALGGMVVPALFFVFFNKGGEAAAGWGIPMATDIAFALGILSLLGKSVPIALKVFLTALAIVDDLGAVLVIAFFYTESISMTSLLVGAVTYVILFWGGSKKIMSTGFYLFFGLILWVAILKSGVHATIGGVLLATVIPVKPLLKDLEHKLHPWVAFMIMPVFALANAGVTIAGSLGEILMTPVSLGIAFGLIFGKQIGITLFSWITVKLKMAELPAGMSIRSIYGVSWLGGIGFTMSLFIASLAFPGNETLLDYSKISIFTASIISGLAGFIILKLYYKKKSAEA